MRRQIWKFAIGSTVPKISMPRGAEILTVQVQHGVPTIWALVDTDAPKVNRLVRVYGTGWDLPKHVLGERYIGTWQQDDGLVWHLFEEV